ncbi:MAG: protein kinase domain-containing protein [Thermoleophilaceae bacterium]
MQDAFSAAELTDGYQLDGYRIESPLSAGAMGAVYRAVRSEDDSPVAIKRLLDIRHVARFEIEARLLSTLHHPRVVNVVDYFQHDTGVYLVMEMIQGTDLGGILKREGGPGIPVGTAIEYTRQACEALQYVHEQQIVHRDVKPANLINAPDKDGVVLVDFGVARLLGEAEEVDQGTVGIGTPRFMAPEVFAGGNVSPRSDVFSLAATLWTLLTGKPPVYGDPTPLSQVAAGASPELEQCLRSGLELLPERRVASAGAFAAALGVPLAASQGQSLALSAVDRPDVAPNLLEAIVKTAAGVFEAAACSIALVDPVTNELVYQASWGAGAKEIVGVRLPPGKGLAGSVVESGEGLAVPDCRSDPRFQAQIAAGTGYVPYTMLVAPLRQGNRTVGTLSVLDRRDGEPYTSADLGRGELFADLTVTALGLDPGQYGTVVPAAPAVPAAPSEADQGTVVS